jgi:hypothetical protein
LSLSGLSNSGQKHSSLTEEKSFKTLAPAAVLAVVLVAAKLVFDDLKKIRILSTTVWIDIPSKYNVTLGLKNLPL